jgi:hypothetical protein
MRIHSFSLGISAGVVFGLYMVGITVAAMHWGLFKEMLDMMVGTLPGYALTYQGAGFGFLYGFAEGFVLFWLIGIFYNVFSRCCKCDG